MGTVTQHLLNVSDARRHRGAIAGSALPEPTSLSSQVVSDRLLSTSGTSGRWPCRPSRSMVTSFRAAGDFCLSLGPGGPFSPPVFAALPPRFPHEHVPARLPSLPPKAPRTARRFFSCPTNGPSRLVLLSPRSAALGGSCAVGRGTFFREVSSQSSRTTVTCRKRSRLNGLDASPFSRGLPVVATIRPSVLGHPAVPLVKQPTRHARADGRRLPAVLAASTGRTVPRFDRGAADSWHEERCGAFSWVSPGLPTSPGLTSRRAGASVSIPVRRPARWMFSTRRRHPSDIRPILEAPRRAEPWTASSPLRGASGNKRRLRTSRSPILTSVDESSPRAGSRSASAILGDGRSGAMTPGPLVRPRDGPSPPWWLLKPVEPLTNGRKSP